MTLPPQITHARDRWTLSRVRLSDRMSWIIAGLLAAVALILGTAAVTAAVVNDPCVLEIEAALR